MPTNTPNLGLKVYNTTTDGSQLFITFRSDIAGTSASSNMSLIDTFAGNVSACLVNLQAPLPLVQAYLSASAGVYTACSTSITNLNSGMMIDLTLNTTTSGSTYLSINNFGVRSVLKANSASPTNIINNELLAGKEYIFRYNGGAWVWVDAPTSDQISVLSGSSGNILITSPCSTIKDGGITFSSSPNGNMIVATDTASAINIKGNISSSGNIQTTQQFVSTASTNPPLVVSSSLVVTNFNADLLGGYSYAQFMQFYEVPILADGRLTVSQGVASGSTGDVSSSSAIWYEPYIGDKITLWDTSASKAVIHKINSPILAASSIVASASSYGSIHDVFVYEDSTSITTPKGILLESTPWNLNSTNLTVTNATNATPIVITTSGSHNLSSNGLVNVTGVLTNTAANGNWRVTVTAFNTFSLQQITGGANVVGNGSYGGGGKVFALDNQQTRTTPLTKLSNGMWVKSTDNSRRYIGTVRVTETGTLLDTAIQRVVYNMYNRLPRRLHKDLGTNSHTYATATWRASNNDYVYSIYWIEGNPEGGTAQIRPYGLITTGSVSGNGGGIFFADLNTRASVPGTTFTGAPQATTGSNVSVGFGLDRTTEASVTPGLRWAQHTEYSISGTTTYTFESIEALVWV